MKLTQDQEIEINLKVYEELCKTTMDPKLHELINLLKNIAEFRTSHHLQEDERLLVLIPDKYPNIDYYKELLEETDHEDINRNGRRRV